LGARGSTGNVGRSDGESEVKGNKGTNDRNGNHDERLKVQLNVLSYVQEKESELVKSLNEN
jgi:hypothetical protein